MDFPLHHSSGYFMTSTPSALQDRSTLTGTHPNLFSQTLDILQSSGAFLASSYSCLRILSRIEKLVIRYHENKLYTSLPAAVFKSQCLDLREPLKNIVGRIHTAITDADRILHLSGSLAAMPPQLVHPVEVCQQDLIRLFLDLEKFGLSLNQSASVYLFELEATVRAGHMEVDQESLVQSIIYRVSNLFADVHHYNTLLGPESEFVLSLDRALATYRPFCASMMPTNVSEAYPRIDRLHRFSMGLERFCRFLACMIPQIHLILFAVFLACFASMHNTSTCTRFYFLYGISTLASLGLSIILSEETRSLPAGFGVGSFTLAAGAGFIAILHKRHKKDCSCVSASATEGHSHDVEMGSLP